MQAFSRTGKNLCFLILFLCAAGSSLAQKGTALVHRESRTVTAQDTVLSLGVEFVNPAGIRILLDSVYTLQSPLDYSLDARYGRITLSDYFRRIFAQKPSARLDIHAEYLPYTFAPEYRRRPILLKPQDSTQNLVEQKFAGKNLSRQDTSSPFAGNFQRSGSIVRGFTIGSNRDLGLSSGFRLQFSGNVGAGMELRGVLSDDNIPIQPEGTTQTLQEFDKVFIEMQSKYLSGTLGDFYLNMRGNEFASFQRKLQGISAKAEYEGTSVELSGALTRGKFTTNEIPGLEGVQGPYRLRGRNGERDIIVIAGTERVFVDGIQQVRGENNDYVIDYNTAEISFRPRRLITGFSRIVVDFEYSDFQFPRSLVASRVQSDIMPGLMNLSVAYLREGDNPELPFTGVLDEEERRILANAGSDRLAASRSGAVFVGRDSASGSPQGSYIRIDTLADGNSLQIYRYAPGDNDALWAVQFSYVGAGQGDYRRRALGEYFFVGIKQGDYAPLRFLPLPELRQNLAADLTITPFEGASFRFAGAGSNFAANRLSDAAQQQGGAYAFTGDYRRADFSLLGLNLAELRWNARVRSVEAGFTEFDRLNMVERNRLWNDSLAQQLRARELTAQNFINLSPWRSLTLTNELGLLRRGDFFNSFRTMGNVLFSAENLPMMNLRLENITSEDRQFATRSGWQKIFLESNYAARVLSPSLNLAYESRDERDMSADTVNFRAFRYGEISPVLQFRPWESLRLRSETKFRFDELPLAGRLERESQSLQQSLAGAFTAGWFSNDLQFTFRDRKFSAGFRNFREGDIQTLLLRNQAVMTPFSRSLDIAALYEVQTERSTRQQRIFIKTVPGQGLYRYTGDANKNGVQEEGEFEQVRFDGDYNVITVPTEQLFPVIQLRTNLRARWQPAKAIDDSTAAILSWLKNISTESWVRIEERSTTERLEDVYLLNFASFRNDSTTLSGALQFQQDIILFETSQDFNLRFRVAGRNSLAQFLSGNEAGRQLERSVRLRWQAGQLIGLQFDGGIFSDAVSSPLSSVNRSRDINLLQSALDLTTKPWQRLELGAKFEVLSGDNRGAGGAVQNALTFSQAVRGVYALTSQGWLKGELEHVKVSAGTADNFLLPYQLTNGNPAGDSWILRSTLEYRFGMLQASLSYLGRIQSPEKRLIHTAQGEVRAFF